MLALTRRPGESILLTTADGQHLATIELIDVRKHTAKIAIAAADTIHIARAELILTADPEDARYVCRRCGATLYVQTATGPTFQCADCGAYDWHKPRVIPSRPAAGAL